MDVRFTLSAVAHLPVYLWPWVWWQLFAIKRWCRVNERQVLWEADERGKVWVTYVSDDPRDLVAWFKRENKLYRAHWAAMHNASGEMHLSGVYYWMGRLMECGERLALPPVLEPERAQPVFQDSS